jgi:hypothetical protein
MDPRGVGVPPEVDTLDSGESQSSKIQVEKERKDVSELLNIP